MVHLIFVHGVNAQTTGFSNTLFTGILRAYEHRLRQNGLSLEQVQNRGKGLVQHEVFWAQDTTDLTNRYLTLQFKAEGRKGKWNFIDEAVDPLVIQILYYVKDKGYKDGPMTILKVFDQAIRQLAFKPREKVVFIAHSLGSVITYDYLFGFRKYKPSPRQKIDGFFSMGSPIPIFSAAMGYPENHLRMPANLKKWINILDPDDGVARYCKRHYPEMQVEDVEVNTGWTPIGAHLHYWQSSSTAKVIADRLIAWRI